MFAAGRAWDKLAYVQRHCPHVLILGNSRSDNGFDPRTVVRALGGTTQLTAFNLGVPGADAGVMRGVVDRLSDAGCLNPGGIQLAVISLDEALVQPVDTLGQTVFFGNIREMWRDQQYHDAFRAGFRLYGFSANFSQLREPATLQRFVRATLGDVDAVGGGPAAHLGYRAGTGQLQDAQAAMRQAAGSLAPPHPANVAHLWRIIDQLSSRAVMVAVVFPPLLNRDVLYLAPSSAQSAPYLQIASELGQRGIPLISLDTGPPRDPGEFVNAGHLNDKGAQRYSALLGQALQRVWDERSTMAAGQRKPAGSP